MGKETFWLITPEAPYDEGQLTEGYFGFLHTVEDEDPTTGDLELSKEPIREDGKYFKNRTAAENFLNNKTGCIAD